MKGKRGNLTVVSSQGAEEALLGFVMEVAHAAFASADRSKIVHGMYRVEMPFSINPPLHIPVAMNEAQQLAFFEDIVGRVEYPRIRENVLRVRPIADFLNISPQLAWRKLKEAAAIEVATKAAADIGWQQSGWSSGDFLSLLRHYDGLVANNAPGYTGGDMSNAAGFLPPLAPTFTDASDKQLEQFVQWGEVAAALLKARGRDRATAEPRPDLSPELVAALLKDSTLGQLQERFEKQLQEIELPEGGFTTKEQAKAGKALAKTFHDLQARLEQLDLPPIEKPPRVTEAATRASYYYDHHTKTGEFIPPRPRGRPRKVVEAETSPPEP